MMGSDWWSVERNEQGRKDPLQIAKADAKHAGMRNIKESHKADDKQRTTRSVKQ